MYKNIFEILKVLFTALCFWLVAEMISPGMMLIPDYGRAIKLFNLHFVVDVIKWGAFLFVILATVNVFYKKLFLDIVLALMPLALCIFLIRTFFMLW